MKRLLYLVPIVVLLAAGCNFISQKTGQTQDTSSSSNTESQANPTISPSPTPTRTVSTKTYSNKEYGFSVDYPTDFMLKTDGTFPPEMPNYLGRFSSDVAMLSLSKASLPSNSGVMSANALISIADNPSGGNYFFSAVDKSQGVPPPVIRDLELEKTVTVNGIKYGAAVFDGAAAGSTNHIKIYHVYRNNMWYEIQLNVWVSSGGNFSLADSDVTWQKLESVLAGFKFTK